VTGSADLSDEAFVAQVESAELPAAAFRHADHLRLSYLYVRRYGAGEAESRIARTIESFARAHGADTKFHASVTHAWVRLVADRIGRNPAARSFGEFLAAAPELASSEVIGRHYSEELLRSEAARREVVDADREPLPG
jgi:hypothetical protein